MPKREVLTCAKCAADIEEDPAMGDRQGCVRRIEHGATTWVITLCARCAKPLWDLYRDYVEEILPGGTAVGAETLRYLPVVEGNELPPPARPTFSRP